MLYDEYLPPFNSLKLLQFLAVLREFSEDTCARSLPELKAPQTLEPARNKKEIYYWWMGWLSTFETVFCVIGNHAILTLPDSPASLGPFLLVSRLSLVKLNWRCVFFVHLNILGCIWTSDISGWFVEKWRHLKTSKRNRVLYKWTCNAFTLSYHQDLNNARLLHALSGNRPISPSLYVTQNRRQSLTLKHCQKF